MSPSKAKSADIWVPGGEEAGVSHVSSQGANHAEMPPRQSSTVQQGGKHRQEQCKLMRKNMMHVQTPIQSTH